MPDAPRPHPRTSSSSCSSAVAPAAAFVFDGGRAGALGLGGLRDARSLADDRVRQVWTVEARFDRSVARPQLQDLAHVVAALLRRGGRERDDRHRAELLVVLAEVVPPGADAVRLVDDHARELARAARAQRLQRRAQRAVGDEHLGRDVQQLGRRLAAVLQVGEHRRVVARARLRAEERGRHAGEQRLGAHRASERGHLVLDEREQRADDDGDARGQHRGKLVAQALPSAGGKQHERVAVRQDRVDRLALLRPEVVVAEDEA
eukprot:2678453-Prymnesium_polylepis.1